MNARQRAAGMVESAVGCGWEAPKGEGNMESAAFG